MRARTVQIVPSWQSQLVRRSPRFPLAARSRFAACSDEKLCREERRARRWWLTGPRRRTEHQLVEQIAVAVPNNKRTETGEAVRRLSAS